MFRIRKVYGAQSQEDKKTIAQVRELMRKEYPHQEIEDEEQILEHLLNPLKYGYRSILFVASGFGAKIKGFALVFHDPGLRFCFLEELLVAKENENLGIEEALYQRVKEEALSLKSRGIFLELFTDDPRLCRKHNRLQKNIENMMFYESLGVRPVINTKYGAVMAERSEEAYCLLYDSLGEGQLGRDKAKKIVKAILNRKHSDICSHDDMDIVIGSFVDDPIRLRKPRYVKRTIPPDYKTVIPDEKKILLISNEEHAIHDVKRRGNVEVPVRIFSILKEIKLTNYFLKIKPEAFPESHLRSVHDSGFVDYLKKVSMATEPDRLMYPYVFPVRNKDRVPRDLAQRIGYYCIDLFTPVNCNAYLAAREAVNCALTGARKIQKGSSRIAYALVRPPGHHAETGVFGGYCYFNSASIAANFLSKYGKTAVLDLDYHHGNGTQQIFYKRSDVLTISIHRNPEFEFPYYAGFKDETGEDEGKGFNFNYPLGAKVDGREYRKVLNEAVGKIREFKPAFLVVALGLDTAKKDPLGTWELVADDLRQNGTIIGSLKLPTLVVQEGGYNTRTIGKNACYFFIGLWNGEYV